MFRWLAIAWVFMTGFGLLGTSKYYDHLPSFVNPYLL